MTEHGVVVGKNFFKAVDASKRGFIHHFIMCCVTAAGTKSKAIAFTVHCHILFVSYRVAY